MTEKECDHQDEYEEKSRKRIVYALLGLIAVVAFVVFLVWAILHPHGPRFELQDVTIYDFKTSQPNLLTTNIQVTISSRNPNDKIGIFYDHVDIYASYRGQQVTPAILLPTTYQGHMEVTVWSPVLYGSDVPVDPYRAPSLNEDVFAGMVLLKIKINGCVKWKVGSWVSGCYRLNVNCPAYINTTVPVVKYHLVQPCAVDV